MLAEYKGSVHAVQFSPVKIFVVGAELAEIVATAPDDDTRHSCHQHWNYGWALSWRLNLHKDLAIEVLQADCSRFSDHSQLKAALANGGPSPRFHAAGASDTAVSRCCSCCPATSVSSCSHYDIDVYIALVCRALLSKTNQLRQQLLERI